MDDPSFISNPLMNHVSVAIVLLLLIRKHGPVFSIVSDAKNARKFQIQFLSSPNRTGKTLVLVSGKTQLINADNTKRHWVSDMA